jgi:hypothetical protein
MPVVTLVGIRHSAVERLSKEKLRVEKPVEHLGAWYPAIMYVPAYPRILDGDLDSYAFECVSANASRRRLRRLYKELGGRMNPPWKGTLVDGVEVNGNTKDDDDQE